MFAFQQKPFVQSDNDTQCAWFRRTWVRERQSMFALPKYMCFLSTTHSLVCKIPPVMLCRSTPLTSAPKRESTKQKAKWKKLHNIHSTILNVKVFTCCMCHRHVVVPVATSSSVSAMYGWGAFTAIFNFTPLGSSCFSWLNTFCPIEKI